MNSDAFKGIEKLEADLWGAADNLRLNSKLTSSEQTMSEQLVSHLPDEDMQAAPIALLRAARRAREIARQTGTAVVFWRDGKLVEERLTAPSDCEPEPKLLNASEMYSPREGVSASRTTCAIPSAGDNGRRG